MKTDDKYENGETYIYISQENRHGTRRWRLYPVNVDKNTQKITNYSISFDRHPFDDFVLTAIFQERKDYTPERPTQGTYGWTMRYETYCTEEQDAVVMLKNFKTIKARLAKLDKELGFARTFSETAVRFAIACRARGFVLCTASRGWSYADGDHSFLGTDSARHYIEEEELKHLNEQWPQTTTPAA